MSRVAPAADVIEVKPANNVYTALVVLAFAAVAVALFVLNSKFGEIFTEGKNLFNG